MLLSVLGVLLIFIMVLSKKKTKQKKAKKACSSFFVPRNEHVSQWKCIKRFITQDYCRATNWKHLVLP